MVKFERELTSAIIYEGDVLDESTNEVCQSVLEELDVKGKAHSISDCREKINQKLTEAGIGMRNHFILV